MWVSRRQIEELADTLDQMVVAIDGIHEIIGKEVVSLRTQVGLLRERVVGLETTNEWLRAQVNTAHLERGALMERALGVPMPTPQIRASEKDDAGVFSQLAFEDVGDDQATIMGLQHDEEGKLR